MRDEERAEEFCRAVGPDLVGFLTLYCGDRDLAEDLAQQTLARVWASWNRMRTVADRRAYVHRMACNAASSWFRRRAAERRARQRAGARRPAETHGAVDPATSMAVRDAVAALPNRQRSAVLLRYYADLSVRETAAVMGCAEGTVKALTFKAVAALREAGLTDDTDEQVKHG